MKWSVKQIEASAGQAVTFDDVLDVSDALMAREPNILAAEPARVSGQLFYQNQTILALCQGDVTVTMPSSRTLEPVPVEIAFAFEERYILAGHDALASQYDDEVVTVLAGQTLDLREAIEDMILLNLPIQVLSATEETMPSGQGWTVVTEDDYYAQKAEEAKHTVDPRLAGLAQLTIDEQAEE